MRGRPDVFNVLHLRKNTITRTGVHYTQTQSNLHLRSNTMTHTGVDYTQKQSTWCVQPAPPRYHGLAIHEDALPAARVAVALHHPVIVLLRDVPHAFTREARLHAARFHIRRDGRCVVLVDGEREGRRGRRGAVVVGSKPGFHSFPRNIH